jgi:hypothetical protein
MTLILTELSRLGIAMAADSALTQELRKPNGTMGDKVYYGAQKLFIVPNLMAGIAYWGWGDIPQPSSDWSHKDKLERTELWLPHFLDENKEHYNSLSMLAQLLEKELRNRIPKIDVNEYPYGDGGIHLAGYESRDGQLLPTFWHIHNGVSQVLPSKKINPTLVNANNDISTENGRQIVDDGGFAIIKNGDIAAYNTLWELLFRPDSAFSKIIRTTGLTFPYSRTLADRANFLKFQIQTVEGLYRFSKEGKGIGSPVTTLTISPMGIMTYSHE